MRTAEILTKLRKTMHPGSYMNRMWFDSSQQTQSELAESRAGRIWLHLVCAWRDHKFAWHWGGIRRELRWAV